MLILFKEYICYVKFKFFCSQVHLGSSFLYIIQKLISQANDDKYVDLVSSPSAFAVPRLIQNLFAFTYTNKQEMQLFCLSIVPVKDSQFSMTIY